MKRKGKIRKSKQVFCWFTLNPNTLNKTESEPSSEDLVDISSNTQTETNGVQPLNPDENQSNSQEFKASVTYFLFLRV